MAQHVGTDLVGTCSIHWSAPVGPAEAPQLVELLDPHERDRLARFRRPADQARYLAAHALTRIVLAEVVGGSAAALVFDRTCRCGEQHGKPTLTGAGAPAFSFTHAGDLVGVAVHATPVGLDVEEVRPLTDLSAMAEHACSPAEIAAGAAASAPGFFSVWTRKEAVLKATGDGLAAPMNAITLGPGRVATWSGEHAPDEPVWVAELTPAPGYRAAVAGLGTHRPVVTEHHAPTPHLPRVVRH